MKLLELFSGTGSVGKVARTLGWDVVSLDLKNADINKNIVDWNYKEYPREPFDMIWSSPPCTEYSVAKTTGVRKIREANNIVLKTLEIIKYFSPRFWFIENPQAGLLKKQPFMEDIDFYDVDYCKYGFRYRKRTRIWTNLKNWETKPLCKKDCGNIIDGKHRQHRGFRVERKRNGVKTTSLRNKRTCTEYPNNSWKKFSNEWVQTFSISWRRYGLLAMPSRTKVLLPVVSYFISLIL